MGKPFSRELDFLGQTFEWASVEDIEAPVAALKSTRHLPLIAVGSGGSFSAAELQATLHRYFFRSTAMAVTPVEMISALPDDGLASVWILSASGNNIDIRRAFQHAALLEPKCVAALVGRKGSKLSDLHEKYHYTHVFEHPLPSGKDGFLASNSLLGFSVLLYRIYAAASFNTAALPVSLEALIEQAVPTSPTLQTIEDQMAPLWGQRTLHVVYSDRYKSMAADIESKFVEAGLGSVHLADMRNFAHGRHHWFDKNANSSGILFLSAGDDKDLADRTLNLLPASIAKGHLNLADLGGVELLAGIVLSMYFTQWRGIRFDIDPGRPGVPDYGSKIYRLTARSGFASAIKKEIAACRRKTRFGPPSSDRSNWQKSVRQFTRLLSKQPYGGLVLDYDGTAVDGRCKGSPPNEDICRELNRLLAGGLVVGFATGRGKSIRHELCSPGAIEQRYWERVVIGYYNGSEIAKLSDETFPDQSAQPHEAFSGIPELISQALDRGSQGASITARRFQLTIEPNEPVPEALLWETICGALDNPRYQCLSIYRSSHSVDILAPGVSKTAVIDHIANGIGQAAVLAIGDRGRWPGNDSQLLASEYSLSVDEVSSSTDTCWNLCPAGTCGPQGLLHYLERIQCDNGVAHFR